MYDMIFSGQLRKRSTACPNKGFIACRLNTKTDKHDYKFYLIPLEGDKLQYAVKVNDIIFLACSGGSNTESGGGSR